METTRQQKIARQIQKDNGSQNPAHQKKCGSGGMHIFIALSFIDISPDLGAL